MRDGETASPGEGEAYARGGFVDTPYGAIAGCSICGLIPLAGPLLCEHGVTAALEVEISTTMLIEDRQLYDRLMGRPPSPGDAVPR